MKQVKILPIFNQAAPGIWDDFLRIRTVTRQQIYNIHTSEHDLSDALSEFKSNWAHQSRNFAFGAYDNDNMIGFISGTFDSRIATIQHLYVLPQYQGQHIGKQLLNSAEYAISVTTSNIELISMTKSEDFYKKNGYISYSGTNHYYKSVKNTGCCTVAPVFRCTPTIVKKTAAISGLPTENFNRQDIVRAHTPMFVYRDGHAQITAVGICGEQSTIYSISDWAKSRIEKAITDYHLHTK